MGGGGQKEFLLKQFLPAPSGRQQPFGTGHFLLLEQFRLPSRHQVLTML